MVFFCSMIFFARWCDRCLQHTSYNYTLGTVAWNTLYAPSLLHVASSTLLPSVLYIALWATAACSMVWFFAPYYFLLHGVSVAPSVLSCLQYFTFFCSMVWLLPPVYFVALITLHYIFFLHGVIVASSHLSLAPALLQPSSQSKELKGRSLKGPKVIKRLQSVASKMVFPVQKKGIKPFVKRNQRRVI